MSAFKIATPRNRINSKRPVIPGSLQILALIVKYKLLHYVELMVEDTSPSGLLSRISALEISNSRTRIKLGTGVQLATRLESHFVIEKGIAVFTCANSTTASSLAFTPIIRSQHPGRGSSCKTRNHARFVKRWGTATIIPSPLIWKVGRRT
jgi:hypothetical protein